MWTLVAPGALSTLTMLSSAIFWKQVIRMQILDKMYKIIEMMVTYTLSRQNPEMVLGTKK